MAGEPLLLGLTEQAVPTGLRVKLLWAVIAKGERSPDGLPGKPGFRDAPRPSPGELPADMCSSIGAWIARCSARFAESSGVDRLKLPDDPGGAPGGPADIAPRSGLPQ